MSSAVYHMPRYRLSRLIKEPGGKRACEAVADARAALETIADTCAIVVGEILARIDAAGAALTEAGPAGLDALYEEVRSLIGVADAAGLPQMDRAAFSLCELVDGFQTRGRFDPQAIAVSIHALHILSRRENLADEASVREVLSGLRKIVADLSHDLPHDKPALV